METDKHTNFFSTIYEILDGASNVTLTIRKDGDNLVVACRPQNGEESKLVMNPLMLVHPPAALDENFFITITTALQKVKSFEESLGEFEKGLQKPTEKKSDGGSSKKSVSKAKTPVKKAATPAKPKAPAKPKLTPEQLKEKKDAEIKTKAAKLATEAERSMKSSNPEHWKGAEKKMKEAMKLHADPAYATALASIQGQITKKQREDQVKINEPKYKKIEALIAVAEFGTAAKIMMEILEKNPDDVRVAEFRERLIVKLGEGFVNNELLKKK